MITYHEILRLAAQGHSKSDIHASTGHSRVTIDKVLARAYEVGDLDALTEKNDAELQAILFPSEVTGPTKWLPNFDVLRKELLRPGVTKRLLWHEYKRDAEAQGYPAFSYSQFCYYFSQEEDKHRASMHINRKPGEQLEVDWSGDKITFCDGVSGKKMQAHIFVAVLSYSQYLYAEAFLDEKEEAFIQGHIHAFEFFGGVARQIVPDNCKTAVTRHTRDESTLNITYREMSEHYATVIIPARVRRPKDKSMAEAGVCATQRLLAELRNTEFTSLAELNRSLRNKVDEFNAQPFQKREGSRRSVFESEEKELLLPLPATPFEIAEWKVLTVQFNYHVSVYKTMYSVPWGYIGKKVDVKITSSMVEVYYNHARIASHKRSYDPKGKYVTVKEHMPREHQHMNNWNGESLRKWAERIGSSTYAMVDRMLSSKKVEQQAYKSCLAVLNLTKKHSESLLEAACEEAVEAGCFSLKAVQNLLKAMTKRPKPVSEQSPDNDSANPNGITRGPSYFGGNDKC